MEQNKPVTITLSKKEYNDCTLEYFKDSVSNALAILTEYVKEINDDDFASIAEPLNILHRSIREQEQEAFLKECRERVANK